MKKHLNPEDAPRMVVAVPSLQPVFALYNSTTYTLKRVYGGNVCENSVYTAGIMPKAFRIAADEENYHHEVILSPLPETIEETVLNDSPECHLVITDFRMMAIQEQEEPQNGRIIRHPAAPSEDDISERLYFEKKVAELAKKARKNKDPKQLYLSPDFSPQSQAG